MDTQATTRSPRHKARNAFWVVYCAGFLLGLLAPAVDLPDVIRIGVVVVWCAALALTGGAWLMHAIRDGALRRALPDYLYAGLGLAAIALGCAATALLGLLAVGADVTVERVTGWAAIGTFAVLVTYWVARWRWS
jgi:hypothetical protein